MHQCILYIEKFYLKQKQKIVNEFNLYIPIKQDKKLFHCVRSYKDGVGKLEIASIYKIKHTKVEGNEA